MTNKLDYTLMSKAEAAKRLGISIVTLQRMHNRGQIPYVKLMGRTLIQPEAINALITNSLKV